MRVQFLAVPVLVLSLFTAAASAQDVLRVSPSTVRPGEESFITIYVSGLATTDNISVTFSGPAGQFTGEPAYVDADMIMAYVPDEVMFTAGRYSVNVYVFRGELTQRFGPGFFNVDVPQEEPLPFFLTVPESIVVEATSPAGAVVSFNAWATDGTPVSCAPATGSVFPLGGTTVRCSATNAAGKTATENFGVMVVDTTAPSITVPASIVTDNPVVAYTVTAADAIDPTPEISCAPSSGSTFPGGTTRVKCQAVDHHQNFAFGSFLVTVTGGAPVLALPEDMSVEATGPGGAVVNYVVSATEDGAVTCTPPSGSTFALGDTTVNCSATNARGTTTGTFQVTVHDFTSPTLSLPSDITKAATSAAGAEVTWVATATDAVDQNVDMVCAPPSGSTFALGTAVVHCIATDDSGNINFGKFRVTVIEIPPPVLTVPNNITREATGPGGRTVTFNATATNGGVVTCSPASGSLFPLGATTVSCTATNAGGSDSRTFKVTVVDTTAPALVVPADITTEATSPAGAEVAFIATAIDIVDGSVVVNCVPVSGSTFALGTTLVQCSASDTRGNTARDSFDVDVVDTTAPVIVSVKPSTGALWPPNHNMERVTLSVIAVDTADLTPTSTILSVSSNQPINGTGDGDAAPDWKITGPLTVELRSERSGSQDRVYTITVQTTDDSGNASTATTTVRVTQSRRR